MGFFGSKFMNAANALAQGKDPKNSGTISIFGKELPIKALRGEEKKAAPKKEDIVKPAALPAKDSSEKKEAKKKDPEKMADQMVNANQDRSYLKDTARRLVNITGQK